MPTESQAQIVEAMFAKQTLSQADRTWLALRILDGSIPPQILELIELRWPEIIAESRRDLRELRGVLVVAGAVTVAAIAALIAVRIL